MVDGHQTVNLATRVYVGSNPTRPTIYGSLVEIVEHRVFRAEE